MSGSKTKTIGKAATVTPPVQKSAAQEPARAVQRKPDALSRLVGSPASVQAKLSVGKPNDPYEQQADAVAQKVVGMTDSEVAQRFEPGRRNKPLLQAKTQPGTFLFRKAVPVLAPALKQEEKMQKTEEKKVQKAEEKKVQKVEEKKIQKTEEKKVQKTEERKVPRVTDKKLQAKCEKCQGEKLQRVDEKKVQASDLKLAPEAKEKQPQKTEEKKVQKAEEKKVQKVEEKKAQKVEEKKVQKAEEKQLQKTEEKKVQKAEEKKVQKAADKNLQAKCGECEEKKLQKAPEKKLQASELKLAKDAKDKLQSKSNAMENNRMVSNTQVTQQQNSPRQHSHETMEKDLRKKEEEKIRKSKEEQLKKAAEQKIAKKEDKPQAKLQAQPVKTVTPTLAPKEEDKLKKKEEPKKAEEKVAKKEEKPQLQSSPLKTAAAALAPKEEDKLKKKEELKKAAEEKVAKKKEEKPQAKLQPQPVKAVTPTLASKEEDKLRKKEELKKAPEEKVAKADDKLRKSEIAAPQAAARLSAKEEDKLKRMESVQAAPEMETAEPALSEDFERKLNGELSGGAKMDASTRAWMEARFGVDFSAVRIHTDGTAARLCGEIGAQAFAYKNHVFFNRGKYQPDTETGRFLIAHELTHVIQQGYALQKSEQPAGEKKDEKKVSPKAGEKKDEKKISAKKDEKKVSPKAGEKKDEKKISAKQDEKKISTKISPRIQRLGWDDVNNAVRRVVPVWTLLTVIMGYNPILSQNVARTPIAWFQGLLDLIPVVGPSIFDKLRDSGMLARAQQWLDTVFASLPTMGELRSTWDRCYADMGIFKGIDGNIEVFRRHFNPIITRIVNFASRVLAKVVEFLRETLLRPLNNVVKDIPGWELITVLIGQNPLTGERKQQTAFNVINGVVAFIPGGQEKLQQLVQSGALERAFQWFLTETRARNLTWARISATFTQAWDSLRAEDILQPVATFNRLRGIFSPLLVDLVGFARAALEKLLELIFEAVMGAGGRLVLQTLQKVRSTFLLVIRDPVGFLRNLVRGVGQGVRQFGTNILRHLQEGVIAWLTGPIAAQGIRMPERWDLKGFIWFGLQILGLTWDRIRARMVEKLGARVVTALETGFEFIMEVREKGIVQALKDRISEFFGGLRDQLLNKIKSFIQERIVMAGIQQVLALLSPVGAVIDAILKTYNTIMFFIDNIRRILEFVNSVLDSITNIATGNLAAAANYIERTMARTIPILLDFLARFLGLGNVAKKVQDAVTALQAWVMSKVDAVIEWVKRAAVRVLQAGRDAAGRIFEWWKTRKSFRTREGETHNMFIEGGENNPELYVASEKTKLSVLIQQAKRYIDSQETSAENRQAYAAAEAKYIVLNAKLKNKSANKQALEQEITALAGDVSKLLSMLLGGFNYYIQDNAGTLSGANLGMSKKEVFPQMPRKQYPLNYVGNVPAVPPKAIVDEEKDEAAVKSHINRIAQRYYDDGFDKGRMSQPNFDKYIKSRFALVIGVNSYRNLDSTGKTNESRVAAVVQGTDFNKFSIAVKSFSWLPRWSNLQTRTTVPFSQVQNAFTALNQEQKERVKSYEKVWAKKQKMIPYGLIRSAIHDSNETRGFVAELRQNSSAVYIHTGDDDAVSLRVGSTPIPQAKYNQMAQLGAQALFSRFDEILKQVTDAGQDLPVLISGGYEFRMKADGGDVEERDALSYLAVQLDLNLRQNLSRVNQRVARIVYFPEQNTMFLASVGPNAKLFGSQSQEGGALMRQVLRRKKGGQLYFDRRAAVATKSERYLVNRDGGATVVNLSFNATTGKLSGLTLDLLREAMEISQSHADQRDFVRRVKQAHTPKAGKIPGTDKTHASEFTRIVNAMYSHYSPLTGLRSMESLKTRLKTYPQKNSYQSQHGADYDKLATLVTASSAEGAASNIQSAAEVIGQGITTFIKAHVEFTP